MSPSERDPRPSRRDLFRTCGPALSLAVGLAGCLSSSRDSRTTSETTPGRSSNVREVDPATVSDRGVPRSPNVGSDTNDPFRTFVVGERPEDPDDHYETPHVWVWNLTGRTATFELALAVGNAELLDLEPEFPAGEPLAVVFRDPRTYEIEIRADDRARTVEIGPNRFRCNASGTDVLVKNEGIEAETISTSMACTTIPGEG